ncbi:MAG TPA: ethanolamine utilization protein EutN [Clostridiales bacterium]|nr:ethanolamine utilization protein EutN [Clostridiales bacterium]
MQLARVVGSLVSTKKSDKLLGMKILVLVPLSTDTLEDAGAPFVSIDTIGAGEGEVVMCVAGSSSRQTDLTENTPVDNSIVAIIDSVSIRDKKVFDKAVGLKKTAAGKKGGKTGGVSKNRQ